MSIELKSSTSKSVHIPTLNLLAGNVQDFINNIPRQAKIGIHQDTPYPGEFGTLVTTITATWDEE